MNSRRVPSQPNEEPSSQSGAEEEQVPTSSGGEPDFDELRHLLVEPERREIDELRRRLDDPQTRVEELAPILPATLRESARQDEKLVDAATPLVEQALRKSIQDDPSVATDILYPVLGPAVWNAVSRAFRSLVESLNRTLEQNLTLRGIQWRWEAYQTGRSIAEIALLHSLVYRVEQVYLIDAQSGILLRYAGVGEGARDHDLMSGMLAAIQDFVRDSFSVGSTQELERLRVGEFLLWIERGPRALLAAVIRGNPRTAQIKEVLQANLGLIHREAAIHLEGFSGDIEPFSLCHPYLEACLQEELQSQPEKRPIAAYVAFAIVLLALAVWGFSVWRGNARRSMLVETLNRQPGIVVVQAGTSGGLYTVSALKDPLAADPGTFVDASGLAADEVRFDIRPYLSLDSEMIRKRAAAQLQPPETVEMAVEGNILRVKGTAPSAWIDSLRREAYNVAGVTELDESSLIAQNGWQSEQRRIEETAILFDPGSDAGSERDRTLLGTLAPQIKSLLASARAAGYQPVVELIGGADSSGPDTLNQRLSQRRAEWVRAALVESGIPAGSLRTRAIVDSDTGEDAVRSSTAPRSVRFRVLLGTKHDVERPR